ncbi:probable secreted protein [Salmonella enterica subsp. enterica]|nr:probable secreted protein [Salmonella enterica subsp. enterica]
MLTLNAQQDYYLQNHRWAHRIISSEGQKDGLYWPTKAGDVPSPLGPNFSPAAPDEGYHGYHFRIISDNGRSRRGASGLADALRRNRGDEFYGQPRTIVFIRRI